MSARGAAGKGKQRDIAGALDGHAEPALMARTHASHAARKDLAALLHKLREDIGALVVDEIHLFDAELANFFLAEILALASARATRATGAALATSAATTMSARAMTSAWAAMAAMAAAFTARRATWSGSLSLFVSHNFSPFH
jgi:hypothetical protein